jgi:ADP-ribose pyrophosphatase YjhB (NUDIX family)
MAVFRRMPGPLRRTLVRSATPSYTVGAVAVLRRADGRIALVEQRHSLGWALPGGLLSRGETPAAALVRELGEELGVHLDPGALPVPYAAITPSVRRVDVVFFVDSPPGARLLAEDEAEVKRCGWFGLDELPELTEPTADILRAVRLL